MKYTDLHIAASLVDAGDVFVRFRAGNFNGDLTLSLEDARSALIELSLAITEAENRVRCVQPPETFEEQLYRLGVVQR